MHVLLERNRVSLMNGWIDTLFRQRKCASIDFVIRVIISNSCRKEKNVHLFCLQNHHRSPSTSSLNPSSSPSHFLVTVTAEQ